MGAMQEKDRWAQWLLERRHGGDRAQLDRQLPALHRFRERVLANAEVQAGDVVLDVGTGTGLIGFGALELAGEAGKVIFADISEDLLAECRLVATDLGAAERCDFLLAGADNLPLRDASVDVVTTRSVLIYLPDKQPAFVEFFRLLRPGGRLSIFEPINSFGFPEPEHLYRGFDASPVRELAGKVRAVGLPPSEHPLLNFDERDLLRFAEQAGFTEIRLEYTAEISRGPHWASEVGWETYKRMSGNPLDPTLEESMDEALDPEEKAEFERFLRVRIETGAEVKRREASAYLRAAKRAA